MPAEPEQIEVPGHDARTVTVASGDTLSALEFPAWLTLGKQGRDVVLLPGDHIRLEADERVVVGGLRGRGAKVRLSH